MEKILFEEYRGFIGQEGYWENGGWEEVLLDPHENRKKGMQSKKWRENF